MFSESLTLMPRNATFAPRASASRCNDGSSALQGPHHEAHMFTTTGWPCSAASWASKAFAPPLSSSLTRLRSAARSAGAPSIGLDTAASDSAAPLSVGLVCVIPTITATVTPIATIAMRALRMATALQNTALHMTDPEGSLSFVKRG